MVLPFMLLLLFIQLPGQQAQGTNIEGVKITTRFAIDSLDYEQIRYVHGDRGRVELRDKEGHWLKEIPGARITRCDLGEMISLDEKHQEYVVEPYPLVLSNAEANLPGRSTTPVYKTVDPTARFETIYKETQDTQEFLGYTAHHAIITQRYTPLPGANSWPQETKIDVWLIDLETRPACDQKFAADLDSGRNKPIYPDTPIQNIEQVTSGKEPTGLPVMKVTTTHYYRVYPNGQRNDYDTRQEDRVKKIEISPLDPSLFEIPAGYKRVAAFTK
jgi:hypothetical protein